jgi:RNA polymerase sigma-70 factor (ECF subfamily)
MAANIDELSDVTALHSCSVLTDDPETLALRNTEVRQIDEALSMIPAVFREVIVLRELEGLSYKEIATVVETPIGTVMSRLARARTELRRALASASSLKGREGSQR